MTLSEVFALSTHSKDRLAWMDYAKGIAIMMVVFRHISIGMFLGGIEINNTLLNLIDKSGLTFRMPLFFLLSGIFFRKSIEKRSESGYIVHKSKTILYPYLIWSLIFTTLQIMMSGYVNSTATFWSYLDIIVNPWGHWWFLIALFNVSILYLVVYLLSKGRQWALLAIGLLFYFTANYLIDFSIAFHIMRLFIFFVVGDMVANAVLNKENHKYLSSYRLLLFFVLSAIAGEWLLYQGIGQSVSGQEQWRNGTLLLLAFSLLGSCAIVWMSYRLALNQNKYLRWIRIIGQHSLYVYLLHSMIGAGMRLFLKSGLGIHEYWVILPLSLTACLLLPIYLYRLCLGWGFWFLFIPEPPLKQQTILKPVNN